MRLRGVVLNKKWHSESQMYFANVRYRDVAGN